MAAYPKDLNGHTTSDPIAKMNPVLRIGLRLLGGLMLTIGVAFFAALAAFGPNGLADKAGQACSTAQGVGHVQRSCDILDVIEFVPVAGGLILVGLVLAFVMRKPREKEQAGVAIGARAPRWQSLVARAFAARSGS
jgi:hypothetical protein